MKYLKLVNALSILKMKKLTQKEILEQKMSKDSTDNQAEDKENRVEFSKHRFQISKCDESFAQKKVLADHLDEFHDCFRYQCKNCGRGFVLSPEIANHLVKCKKPMKKFDAKTDPDPDNDVSEYEQIRLRNIADVQSKYNQLLKDLGKEPKTKKKYVKRQKPKKTAKATKFYKTRKIKKQVKKTALEMGMEVEGRLDRRGRRLRKIRQNYRESGFQTMYPFNQYPDWS